MNEIEKLIFDLMSDDYEYNGHSINLMDLGWDFRLDNSKRRFGMCSPRKKLISISYQLSVNNYWNPDIVRNTVLHEIAHAIHWELYKEASHNWLWNRIALAIGCDGNRCFSSEEVEMPQSKYSLVCPKCGRKYKRYRKPTRNASCRSCSGGTYNPQYKLEIIQNW